MYSNTFFFTIYNKVFSKMKELREEILCVLKNALLSEEVSVPQNTETQNVKPKSQAIRFNPGLENEYIVTFSERGFLIDNTRMSFEEIENALSKEYFITLKGGTVLDLVKMQQILKYKDRY